MRDLTEDERSVLQLFIDGLSARAIAGRLMLERVDVDLMLFELCGSNTGRAVDLLHPAAAIAEPADVSAAQAAHTDTTTTLAYTRPPAAPVSASPGTVSMSSGRTDPTVLEQWRTHRCPVCRYTGTAAGHTGRCGPVQQVAVTITVADGGTGWPPSHAVVIAIPEPQ